MNPRVVLLALVLFTVFSVASETPSNASTSTEAHACFGPADCVATLLTLAKTEAARGHRLAASASFKKAVALVPTVDSAFRDSTLLDIALAMRNSGFEVSAERIEGALLRSLKVKPYLAIRACTLNRAHFERLTRDLTRSSPESRFEPLISGLRLAGEGRLPQAVATVEAALRETPYFPEAELVYGDILGAGGNTARAKTAWTRSLGLFDVSPGALVFYISESQYSAMERLRCKFSKSTGKNVLLGSRPDWRTRAEPRPTITVHYSGTFVTGLQKPPVNFTAPGQSVTLDLWISVYGRTLPTGGVGSFEHTCLAAEFSRQDNGTLMLESKASGDCTATISVGPRASVSFLVHVP